MTTSRYSAKMQMQVEQKLNFYIFRLDGRQWGNTSLSDNGCGWVYFPLRFPNAAYILEYTHYNSLDVAINVYLETSYLDTDKAYVRSNKDSTRVHFLAVGH